MHGRERKTERRAAKQKASRLKTELCRLDQSGTEDSHQLEQSCAEQEERAVRQDMCVYQIKKAEISKGKLCRSDQGDSSPVGQGVPIRSEQKTVTRQRIGKDNG